jgi:hypothetical protein
VYELKQTTRRMAVLKVASSERSHAIQKTTSFRPIHLNTLRNPSFFSVTIFTRRICIEGIHAATK